MPTERQMQFRVGALVLLASSIGIALTIRFGELQHAWQKTYAIRLELPHTAGLYPSAPVQIYGLHIGRVSEVRLNPAGNGVVATLEIRQTQPIPADSRIMISKAILGETTVAVIPGTSTTSAVSGAVLPAASAVDPLELVQRMEGRVTDTLSAFETTGQEWRRVAVNLNSLMETHEGNLGVVIENAARSLSVFTASMESAQQLLSDTQRLVADPQIQQSLKQTLVALPEMVRETRSTILASRQAIQQMEKNLANLSNLTEPLAQRGPAIATKLDSSLNNLDLLLTELSRFGRLLNEDNGTLHKLAADPELYDNLNRSAQSLTLVLRNVEPMLGDLREFSDKIARNPELLGVGGAVRPSGGLRDNELLEPERVTPVSGRSGLVPRR